MRYPLILAVVLMAAPAFAQTPAAHPYGLDPYNPSDAKLLRDWGGVLVQQTPLIELATLDPFKPSDAALLRRIGDGSPLLVTGFAMQAGAAAGVRLPFATTALRPATAAADARSPIATVPGVPATVVPSTVATLLAPENNDGVWLRFAGQKWLSAGKAIPVAGAALAQAGDYAGFPVYRRQGASDDTIYLPTTEGMVAPYRRKQ